MKKISAVLVFLTIVFLIITTILFLRKQNNQFDFQLTSPEVVEEFEIRGLNWRTVSYYYHSGIYKELYNAKDNLRLIKKAKNIGANYLLIRVFYDGTETGGLIGSEEEAKNQLKEAISAAHDYGIKIFLVPYVESRDYWGERRWELSEEVWTETVLQWAEFAEENQVEIFAPGIEMSIILEKNRAGEWLKEILPQIRSIFKGKVVTAEHYDIERWKILDSHDAFAGYDCIGLTLFPRKEYGGISDIRSFDDYEEYVEREAEVIDMLAEKYNIDCKLAIPMGLDFWQGCCPPDPHPSAEVTAETVSRGLDILKKHNFTGVLINHWASEEDHFGEDKEVEEMLRQRWTE